MPSAIFAHDLYQRTDLAQGRASKTSPSYHAAEIRRVDLQQHWVKPKVERNPQITRPLGSVEDRASPKRAALALRPQATNRSRTLEAARAGASPHSPGLGGAAGLPNALRTVPNAPIRDGRLRKFHASRDKPRAVSRRGECHRRRHGSCSVSRCGVQRPESSQRSKTRRMSASRVQAWLDRKAEELAHAEREKAAAIAEQERAEALRVEIPPPAEPPAMARARNADEKHAVRLKRAKSKPRSRKPRGDFVYGRQKPKELTATRRSVAFLRILTNF